MINIMVDLETLGTGPQAAIVAIGAVAFGPGQDLGQRFYVPVDLVSSVALGGQMDPQTVLWWVRQGVDARALFDDQPMPLPRALAAFSAWVDDQGGDPEAVRLWGNGPAFDNAILASAFRACGLEKPWKHWNDRCYRTLKALFPTVHPVRANAGAHHALADAEFQAAHAAQLLAMMDAMQRPAPMQLAGDVEAVAP